jgi:hypothetical protein
MYHIMIMIHSLIRISMFLHTKPTTIFIGFLNVINVIFIKIVLFFFVKIVGRPNVVYAVKHSNASKKINWSIKNKMADKIKMSAR